MGEYDVSDSGEVPVDTEGLLDSCKELQSHLRTAYKQHEGESPDEHTLQMIFNADFLKGIQEQLVELTQATEELVRQVSRNGGINILRQRGRDS